MENINITKNHQISPLFSFATSHLEHLVLKGKKITMQISEVMLTVGQSGDLLIPANLLTEMGVAPNFPIHIAYLTHDGETNALQELFLSPDGLERIQEDVAIQAPNTLLEQAGLTDGDNLKILCLDGCILICRNTTLCAEDLRGISEQLGQAENLTSALSFNALEAQNQLADFISHFEERSKDESY